MYCGSVPTPAVIWRQPDHSDRIRWLAALAISDQTEYWLRRASASFCGIANEANAEWGIYTCHEFHSVTEEAVLQSTAIGMR